MKVLAARLEHSAVSVNQLAFTKDGCLVAYSCLRHVLAANPGWVCWSTDESNAFQRASRPEMARLLMAEFPECVPYFLGCYDAPSDLYYGSSTVSSRHGAQQGCSWGGFLYFLAKKNMMAALLAHNPDVFFVAIANDIFMAGEPANVAVAAAEWRL
eukprot:SAG11_NODE_14368_length_614_cov_2.180583_1_plen_156_part_00